MQKINAEELNIIVKNMPESIRNLWEAGREIKIKILRKKPLKRYGDEIILRIWRNMIIDSDLEEYEKAEDIAENILGYFLHGECGKIIVRKYTGEWKDYPTYDFGIQYAIV